MALDIFPNYMAVGGSENAWWTDVLQYGRSSRFVKFFDIDWEPADPLLRGKVLAPFLGSTYGYAMNNNELLLGRDSSANPVVVYFGQQVPISLA
jgi:(1->4)-alpha-D-glucan 1-alpha-D-glucosylmutase